MSKGQHEDELEHANDGGDNDHADGNDQYEDEHDDASDGGEDEHGDGDEDESYG